MLEEHCRSLGCKLQIVSLSQPKDTHKVLIVFMCLVVLESVANTQSIRANINSNKKGLSFLFLQSQWNLSHVIYLPTFAGKMVPGLEQFCLIGTFYNYLNGCRYHYPSSVVTSVVLLMFSCLSHLNYLCVMQILPLLLSPQFRGYMAI